MEELGLANLSPVGIILLRIVFVLVLMTALAVIIRRLGNRLVRRLSKREAFDPTNYNFLLHSITAIIALVALGLIIYMIPGLKHVAQTLVTGAGILAVIVGFASQQALSNVVSGVFIVIFKPYRINDRVTIKDTLNGVVEDISLRHTVIRNFENRRIIIPNSVISQEVVVNANYNDDLICRWIDFSVAYGTDIEKVRKLVGDLASAHPNFIDHRNEEQRANGDPVVPVRVLSLGEYDIKMRAWAWAAGPGEAFELGCDVLESIVREFPKAGIEIPYPYRNVYLRKEGE